MDLPATESPLWFCAAREEDMAMSPFYQGPGAQPELDSSLWPWSPALTPSLYLLRTETNWGDKARNPGRGRIPHQARQPTVLTHLWPCLLDSDFSDTPARCLQTAAPRLKPHTSETWGYPGARDQLALFWGSCPRCEGSQPQHPTPCSCWGSSWRIRGSETASWGGVPLTQA